MTIVFMMTINYFSGLSWKKNESLTVWGLVLYAFANLGSMATMSIGMAIMVVVVLVGVGGPAPFYAELRKLWLNPWVRRFGLAALALFGTVLISLIVAKVYPLGFCGKFPQISFWSLAHLQYLALPFVLLVGLKSISEQARWKILRLWLMFFAFFVLIGIQQHFTGWPRPWPIDWWKGHFRVTTFLRSYLSVASIYIFPFFLVLAASFEKELRKKLDLPRWFLGTTTALGFLCLMGTFSKALMVALPVGIVLWFWLYGSGRVRIIAVGMFLIAVFLASQSSAVRLMMRTTGAQRSFSDRITLWQTNLGFIKARPLTGVGFRLNEPLSGIYLVSEKVKAIVKERYPDDVKSLGLDAACTKYDHDIRNQNPKAFRVFAGHAHNNWIEAFSGTGLLGLISWAALVLIPIWALFILLKSDRPIDRFIAKALLAAWLVFHLNGLTQVNFWESKVFHQFAWMSAWCLFFVASRPIKN